VSDNFVKRCRTGRASPADIDAYVEKWHNSDSELELHEYLGLAWDGYRAWAADKTVLESFLRADAENACAPRSALPNVRVLRTP
jgi:hypothetical protein